MKENEIKNRSVHMNNNPRNTRQSDNKPDGRPESRPEGRPEGRSEGRQANGQQPQQNRQQWRNDNYRRDGQGYKSYNRDRDGGHNRDTGFKPGNNAQAGIAKKIKTEETIDDIRADLARIEKEIELEIKQIATMRLGV